MKTKTIIVILIALVLTLSLAAQSLIKDRNGKPIPYIGSSWTAQTVACSADTVWTSHHPHRDIRDAHQPICSH